MYATKWYVESFPCKWTLEKLFSWKNHYNESLWLSEKSLSLKNLSYKFYTNKYSSIIVNVKLFSLSILSKMTEPKIFTCTHTTSNVFEYPVSHWFDVVLRLGRSSPTSSPLALLLPCLLLRFSAFCASAFQFPHHILRRSPSPPTSPLSTNIS